MDWKLIGNIIVAFVLWTIAVMIINWAVNRGQPQD